MVSRLVICWGIKIVPITAVFQVKLIDAADLAKISALTEFFSAISGLRFQQEASTKITH
ncbi:MAG: hypothetical protein ACI9YL_002225 [Luteibaculaceae bacterium]|jgi:hypothetical protein